MEPWTRLAWLALGALHVLPATVLFAPALAERLYGVSPTADAGVLIVHRGALFLGLVAVATWAAFDPDVRRPASIALALGIVGFLAVYARAGAPAGALRPIAAADAAALVPLALVLSDAWLRGRPGPAP